MDAKPISGSLSGNGPGAALMRTKRLRDGPALTPGRSGFHSLAGESVDSRATFRGPVRRPYTAAIFSRQLEAASSRASRVNSICTSFSASAKVAGETSGPSFGPVPNAGGIPGGGSFAVCARARAADAAPSRFRDPFLKKFRREIGIFTLSVLESKQCLRKKKCEARNHRMDGSSTDSRPAVGKFELSCLESSSDSFQTGAMKLIRENP